MANVPTTIVIQLNDMLHFPPPMAMAVFKQVFQYGRKDIKTKGDKIIVHLTYSPKAETLKRKFGNLPVSYIRVNLETEEELAYFEKSVKRYTFNLVEDDDAVKELEPPPAKKLALPETSRFMLGTTLNEDDDDYEDVNPGYSQKF